MRIIKPAVMLERLAAFSAANGLNLTLPSPDDVPEWISMTPFTLTELGRIHGDDTRDDHGFVIALFANCRTFATPSGEIVTETDYGAHGGPCGPGPR